MLTTNTIFEGTMEVRQTRSSPWTALIPTLSLTRSNAQLSSDYPLNREQQETQTAEVGSLPHFKTLNFSPVKNVE